MKKNPFKQKQEIKKNWNKSRPIGLLLFKQPAHKRQIARALIALQYNTYIIWKRFRSRYFRIRNQLHRLFHYFMGGSRRVYDWVTTKGVTRTRKAIDRHYSSAVFPHSAVIEVSLIISAVETSMVLQIMIGWLYTIIIHVRYNRLHQRCTWIISIQYNARNWWMRETIEYFD